MDHHLDQMSDPYFQQLVKAKDSLDFLMVQFYNGNTINITEVANGCVEFAKTVITDFTEIDRGYQDLLIR